MKIGLITHQYPGARGGGIGTYVIEAAQSLATSGHEVHVFTFTLPGGATKRRSDEATEGKGDCCVHQVRDLAERVAEGTLPGELQPLVESGWEGAYRLALGWLLCEAVRVFHREHRLDIVEGPEYEALALPLMLRPEPDLPVVTHLHLCSAVAREGNEGMNSEFRIQNSELNRLIDGFEGAAIGLADAVCAPTRNIVELTRRVTGIGRDAEVIPHPMRVPAGCMPVPEKGPVLFVGRLEPRKGTDLMPEAFNRFLARNSDAVIRLVGSDTEWGGGSVRERLIAELDNAVRGRVVFAGEKSPDEVRREFAACRFSICPSLLESFGYVAAESMIAGRSVVVSSVIGATEVVGDGGLVFERGSASGLADAMERLWRDRQLCAELGQRAFDRAREIFVPERNVARRVAFYQATIDRLRRGPRTGVDEQLHKLADSEAMPWLKGLSGLAPLPEGSVAPDSPGARLLNVMEEIGGGKPASVMLYGAGRFTTRLFTQRRLWESRGHRVAGLIDDHPRFAKGGVFLGLPVCSRETALARARGGDRIASVVLSTDTFQEQFWRQTEALRENHVQIRKLYGPTDAIAKSKQAQSASSS